MAPLKRCSFSREWWDKHKISYDKLDPLTAPDSFYLIIERHGRLHQKLFSFCVYCLMLPLDILSGGWSQTSFPVGKPTGPEHIMEVRLISWKSHLAMSFLDIQCCLLGLTFCMNISQLASRNWVGSATNVLTGASRTTRNPGREVKMNNAAKSWCLLWKLS